MPRRLSPDEVGLWARVAGSVRPLSGRPLALVAPGPRVIADRPTEPVPPPKRNVMAHRVAVDAATLDGSWERKVRTGRMVPDLTIDLHGYSRDRAQASLTRRVVAAAGLGARVVLVITGKGTRRDDHGTSRGIIAVSLRDWLHGPELRPYVAALRPAHPRHGGGGAWYVILRR